MQATRHLACCQVLIESDWNLKLSLIHANNRFAPGINRIRLEFKVIFMIRFKRCWLSINRIRLEFKGLMQQLNAMQMQVLIESDWNLKWKSGYQNERHTTVLIESDWNLKHAYTYQHTCSLAY